MSQRENASCQVYSIENHPNDSRVKIREDNKVQTLSSRMGTGGGNIPMVMYAIEDDITPKIDGGSKAFSLRAREHKGVQVVVTKTYEKQSYCSWIESDKSATLHAQAGQVGTGGDSAFMLEQEKDMDEEKSYVVRRLTPDECALLQGYPIDWCNIGDWTDTKGKIHKDSDTAKYKAYGNSIALPQWQWIIDRMAAYLPENAKLGSLFDGIGGFPLCWERTHGKGTARWASEVEEFCIAVTKYHFPENNSGENAKFGMSVEENIQPPIAAKVAGGVSGPSVVQGFDAYNQAITGDVAMPLRNKAADSDHIPVVCLDDK